MRSVTALPAWLAPVTPDPWTTPFWAAAREHRLVAPCCTHCATFRFPPGPFCHICQRQEVEYVDLPGTGSIYTFTIARHPVLPELKESVPYVIAVLELDGAPGIRLIANVVSSGVDQLHIGCAVKVTWDDVTDEVTIPRFELAP